MVVFVIVVFVVVVFVVNMNVKICSFLSTTPPRCTLELPGESRCSRLNPVGSKGCGVSLLELLLRATGAPSWARPGASSPRGPSPSADILPLGGGGQVRWAEKIRFN